MFDVSALETMHALMKEFEHQATVGDEDAAVVV
jgi:hypothetical protein